ncbi:hypothetical protein MJ575_13505 [Klebsiella pneumoniae]|nr:hypothetical protein MJ575_13505 [Klebsiella pneumoniae]
MSGGGSHFGDAGPHGAVAADHRHGGWAMSVIIYFAELWWLLGQKR